MKKRIISIVLMVITAISTCLAAESADWYLYLYSDAAGLNGDAGQFVSTESDGVYRLDGVSLPASGINYCIHNSAWSAIYGWADGGSVESTGTDYPVAAATSANGWLAVEAGVYDVIWDSTNLTIRLEPSSSTEVKADWFLYVYSEEHSLNADLAQFVTTDTENVFEIKECNVPAQGIGFCVHNAAWSQIYGMSDEGGIVAHTGSDVALDVTTTASAQLDLPAGIYKVTWNATAKTIRFDTISGVPAIVALPSESNKGVYNMAGQRVAPTHKGIVIVNGKKIFNR